MPALSLVRRTQASLRVPQRETWIVALIAAGAMFLTGCGTTRMSDSARTATEQLLVSSAIDKAINDMNFQTLNGKDVYFDSQYLKGAVDENYVISSVRQALLANGCFLKESREDASYVVEARSGAIGTNRNELLVGVPQTNLSAIGGAVPGVPNVIPEIPFAKRTDQYGVAKLAVYAYHRDTGLPVWQSGAFPITTNAKNAWVLGTGPFQKGTIYDGTRFAGNRIRAPWEKKHKATTIAASGVPATIPVTAEVVFPDPAKMAQKKPVKPPVTLVTGEEEMTPLLKPAAATPPADKPAPPPAAPPATPISLQYTPSGFSNSHDPLGTHGGMKIIPGPSGQVIRMPSIDRPDRMEFDNMAVSAGRDALLVDHLLDATGLSTSSEVSGGGMSGLLRSAEWWK